jgi:uncharacterized protein (DUF1800 family)
MPLNLRHAVVAASVSGALLLLTACSSTNGSNPATSTSSTAPTAPAAVTVSVNGSATVTLGSTSQYAATVSGSTNQSVSWTVNQAAGGNAQLGTISTTGVYTAPATMPFSSTVTIAAISVAAPTVSSSISVALQAPVQVPVGPTPPQATATAAARFLDQTSFGPTATTIAHVQQIGLQAALTEQFNQPASTFSEPPSPDAECPAGNLNCTQSDFLKVTAWGNDQLRQRVAMALSELWVAPIVEDNAMPFYLNTLANDAFTNYRTIMQDVTLTPEMGAYLNMANSEFAAPGQIANENFGREMMQLFTLGPNLLNADGTLATDSSGNTIPTYTQLQVEAFARAYTGWTYANPDGSAPQSSFNGTGNWNYSMVPVETKHDTNAKVLLLGTTLPQGQTAEQDLKGALDNIFAHPNIGPFICRQLIQHLVTGNPSPGYVQRVSEVFANNGSGVQGDMKAVLTAIIMDQEARAGDVQTGDQAESDPAVDGGHLREPLLWTLNLVRGLGATQTNPSDPYPFVIFMARSLGTVGEAPFTQPSVFNYFSPQYVIPQTDINSPEFGLENTGMIVPRESLADSLIHSAVPGLTVDLSATSAIGQQASNPAQLADYLGMLFMHSQMPTDMRSALITTISAIPATDLQSRVQVAVYLVVTSSQYKIIH